MRTAGRATFGLRIISLVGLVALSGCASLHRAPPAPIENPLAIPASQCDAVWDGIIDVVDDYFDVQTEQRVRRVGDVLTVGRIDTVPQGGATILEPWRHDAVNFYERMHGTLQTIRRRAVVQVIPAGEVFQVEVVVYKELEDLISPTYSPAGAATFRDDSSFIRFEEPVGLQPVTLGWIPLGRDTALEQEILAKILEYVGPTAAATSMPLQGWMPSWLGGEQVPPPAGVDTTLMRPQDELLPPPGSVAPPETSIPPPF